MSLKRKNTRQRENEKLQALARDPVPVLAAIAAVQEGLTSYGQGDLTGAITQYKAAIAQNPRFAEAHYVLGAALRDTGDIEGAIACFRQTLVLNQDHSDACYRLGDLLAMQGKYIDAALMLQKSIELYPKNVDAHNRLGQVYFKLFLFKKSRETYEAGLELAPDHAGLYHNLAISLTWLNRQTEALEAMNKAVALAPNSVNSLSNLVYTRSQLCAWDGLEALSSRTTDLLMDSSAIIDPFTFQCFPTGPGNAEQFICARRFGASIKPSGELKRHRTVEKSQDHRIRVGYVSMDFRSHPMAYLMTDVLEKHDRSKFEVFAYSFGPPDSGLERKRFIEVCDHFTDIQKMTNFEAAQRIYDDDIDILIDRKGYTFGNRIGIFSLRPAPIQVNYLAYGGTMGADFIDYIVLDSFVVPPDQQQYYSERLVYLPDTYQPNSVRPVSDATPSRAECGLPENAFVFCGFNQTPKITPAIFDVWMRILHKTPDSVLWLMKPDETTADNLRMEAVNRGMDPSRLVFASKMPQAAHLARHRHINLFLDTTVINALTTASDALFMEVPLITCPGQTFVSRGAGSILNALEMPELITANLQEYEELAVMLAANPARLHSLREKIAQKKKTAPLFDSTRYTKYLDAAYLEMWRLQQAGDGPKAFAVKPVDEM